MDSEKPFVSMSGARWEILWDEIWQMLKRSMVYCFLFGTGFGAFLALVVVYLSMI